MWRARKTSVAGHLIEGVVVSLIIAFLFAIISIDAGAWQREFNNNCIFIIFAGTSAYVAISLYILCRRPPTAGDWRFFKFGVIIPYIPLVVYMILA